jgi:hypothetical protein
MALPESLRAAIRAPWRLRGEGDVHLTLPGKLLNAPEAETGGVSSGKPLVPDHLHELPVPQAYLNAEFAFLVVEAVAVAALLFA